jgi:beta-galactosidase
MISIKHTAFRLGMLLLLLPAFVNSQGRISFSINDNWRYAAGGFAYAETGYFDDHEWELVNLPHSWNVDDPFDDDHTYRRGISWYRKTLDLDQQFNGKKVFLYFEGANQVANVYVNGSFAGQHKGGYTGFSVDITKYLLWKQGSSHNTIAIQVSNAHDPFIPPLNVGYASYGGIYRDVWVISTGSLHFENINNNSGGVFITTPVVSKQQARIHFSSTIRNDGMTARNYEIRNMLTDAAGQTIQQISKSFSINAGSSQSVDMDADVLNSPHLWSPSDPYLYHVKSSLISNGEILDEVDNRIGFRWFSFDAGNGFSLNGEKLVLHGTNRHQDMKGKADALSIADHRRDMQLVKEMGCNFVRLAHYPQAAAVLSLADELGLLIWEEVPVVNFITDNDQFVSNTENMIKEMITQGFNHPSVIMWGSSNEILLHGRDGERIGRQNDSAYVLTAKKFFTKFDSTVRAEDPSRYSTVAMHISGDYGKYGFDTVSQVAGYNIYSGWYSGKVEDFGNDLDRRKRAGHNVFVSEYGAEGEVRLNSERPVRFDYTGQYQRYYHESYLRQINQRPWLAGTAIWNEFDFSQPNIGGPAPHMNQKGLVTWDRKPKDAYYFYKANWNPSPMIYIASRDWMTRAGEAGAMSTVDVYSNTGIINLKVNGVLQPSQQVNDMHRSTWQVKLKNGQNIIEASGKRNGVTYSDVLMINYIAYPKDLRKDLSFTTININCGSNAQYLDAAGTAWLDDRHITKVALVILRERLLSSTGRMSS